MKRLCAFLLITVMIVLSACSSAPGNRTDRQDNAGANSAATGKDDTPDTPAATGKDDTPDTPAATGKDDTPGTPAATGKDDTPGTPAATGKPDTADTPTTPDTTQSDGVAGNVAADGVYVMDLNSDYVHSAQIYDDRVVISGNMGYSSNPDGYWEDLTWRNCTLVFPTNGSTAYQGIGGAVEEPFVFTRADVMDSIQDLCGLALVIWVQNGVATVMQLSS